MNTYWKVTQWLALALVVGLGAIWEFYPLPDASPRLDALPLSGPGFSGYDVPIDDLEKSVFQDNRLVKRVYRAAGQSFFLSIVDGTKHRSAVHDPTLCFQGKGWSIADRRPLPLVGGSGEILVLEREGETMEVAVWFSNGHQRYSSLVRYWFDTALRRLTLGKSGREPIRIIVQPVEEQPINWTVLIREFYPLWQL